MSRWLAGEPAEEPSAASPEPCSPVGRFRPRSCGTPLGALDDAVSFDEFTDLVGLPEIREFERSVTGG